MADRNSQRASAAYASNETLIRRMEALLERPLTAEEVRLILLAETIRREIEPSSSASAA